MQIEIQKMLFFILFSEIKKIKENVKVSDGYTLTYLISLQKKLPSNICCSVVELPRHYILVACLIFITVAVA